METGGGPTGSPWFAMMSEIYGGATATATARLSQGLANGFTFHPPLSRGEQQFLSSASLPFACFAIPSKAGVASCYPSSTDDNAATLLTTLTGQLGQKVWRLGMPEFDQGGGCWANTDLTGAAWNGTLSFQQPGSTYSVKEWTGDTSATSSVANGKVVVNATVPAFDVRVYVLDTL